MQVLLEKGNGVRTTVTLANYGLDRVKLNELIKSGHVYHVIRTEKVEVIRLNMKGLH